MVTITIGHVHLNVAKTLDLRSSHYKKKVTIQADVN